MPVKKHGQLSPAILATIFVALLLFAIASGGIFSFTVDREKSVICEGFGPDIVTDDVTEFVGCTPVDDTFLADRVYLGIDENQRLGVGWVRSPNNLYAIWYNDWLEETTDLQISGVETCHTREVAYDVCFNSKSEAERYLDMFGGTGVFDCATDDECSGAAYYVYSDAPDQFSRDMENGMTCRGTFTIEDGDERFRTGEISGEPYFRDRESLSGVSSVGCVFDLNDVGGRLVKGSDLIYTLNTDFGASVEPGDGGAGSDPDPVEQSFLDQIISRILLEWNNFLRMIGF